MIYIIILLKLAIILITKFDDRSLQRNLGKLLVSLLEMIVLKYF
jgi:hypothetical protein